MKQKSWFAQGMLCLLLALVLAGCAGGGKNKLLPSTDFITSRWETYEEIIGHYGKVEIGTSEDRLKELGIYDGAKNIEVLNWLSVYNKLPEYAIETRKLDGGILDFIDAGNGRVRAFEITISFTHTHREGSTFLDLLSFRRVTRTLGYTFHGMILLVDNKVVYILKPTGGPIDTLKKDRKPLGPLQNLGKIPASIAW